MAEVNPGDLVAGKYRVERVLGEGGMGIVVAAMHTQLGQLVALKFMRREALRSESQRRRFLREARASVKLKSQHAARVLDVGTLDDGSPYIVMEYLEGIDLSALLKKRGTLPVADATEYVLQACEAIGEAHQQGIVHRDLKPANLFLTRGPAGNPLIKVLDFGVSKLVGLGGEGSSSKSDATAPGGKPIAGVAQRESGLTRVNDLVGSPSYMAPEQLISARDADARSDIWSLGIILYRLVSGRGAFPATSVEEQLRALVAVEHTPLGEVRPDLPAGFEAVVARCLEKDPARRYPDVTSLARALAPFAPPSTNHSLERIAILGPAIAHGSGATQSGSASGAAARSRSVAGAWESGAHAAVPAVAEPVDPGRKVRFANIALAGLVVAGAAAGAFFAARRTPEPNASPSAPMPLRPVSSALGAAPSFAPVPPAAPSSSSIAVESLPRPIESATKKRSTPKPKTSASDPSAPAPSALPDIPETRM